MANKIYKRLGLRRDQDLGDVDNSKQALNNILDGLAATGAEVDATFISEDLDCIRNIASAGLTVEDYQEVGGSAATITDENGDPVIFKPRITYQNRLDRAQVISGTPRIYGGDGLDAAYYNNDQIFENTEDIFAGSPVARDQFWEEGEFQWDRKITAEANDTNGGIKWEGYFIPTETGLHKFVINTQALWSVEFQEATYVENDDNQQVGTGATYTNITRVGIASTMAATGTSGTNEIRLDTNSEIKYIAEGMNVSGTGIAANTTVANLNVNWYDTANYGKVTLATESGNAVTGTINSGNITFTSTQNSPRNNEIWTPYVLVKGNRYRIKISYYVPQSWDTRGTERYFFFRKRTPRDQNLSEVHYYSFYGLEYNFTEAAKGFFNLYNDNSVLAGGTNQQGLGSLSNSDDYITLKTSKKIDIKYQALGTSANDILGSTVTVNSILNSPVVNVSNTSDFPIGTYVYDNTNKTAARVFNEGTRVVDYAINNSIVLSNPANSTASNIEIQPVQHRGHVKRIVTTGTAASGSNEISMVSGYTVGAGTTEIRVGMLAVHANIPTNTKITEVSGGGVQTFTLSENLTGAIAADQIVYLYHSEGLVNDTLRTFCPTTGGNETHCLMARSDHNGDPGDGNGDTTINVYDATNANVGDKVQGYYFEDDTEILSKTSSGAPGSGSSHTIVIDKGLNKNIKAGNNFTITSASDNRQLCCPPKDTSPPFEATDTGMKTPDNYRNLTIDGGNIVFDNLTCTNFNTTKIVDDNTNTATYEYKGKIPIECGDGNTYNLLEYHA
tara:strand:+ start:380 stop:2737 length:2358 start_codon:yes stop_codon:yes gene_type:complete